MARKRGCDVTESSGRRLESPCTRDEQLNRGAGLMPRRDKAGAGKGAARGTELADIHVWRNVLHSCIYMYNDIHIHMGNSTWNRPAQNIVRSSWTKLKIGAAAVPCCLRG